MRRASMLVAVAVVLAVVGSGAVAGASGPFSLVSTQEDAPTDTTTPTPTATPTAASDETNTTDANASFGLTVASFAQASAAEAEGEVSHGMFAAAVNRSEGEARAAAVRQRTATLSERVTELREERAALLDDTDLNFSERARAARLATRANQLAQNINQTSDIAARVGVNTTRLERLRDEADELTGPKVAEIARGLAGMPDAVPGAPGLSDGVPGPNGERGPGDRGNA
ncbi:MAG: hypothetical protein ABEJ05_09320, partial [Haloglomus sp.]